MPYNLHEELAKVPGEWSDKVRAARRFVASNWADRPSPEELRLRFSTVLLEFESVYPERVSEVIDYVDERDF